MCYILGRIVTTFHEAQNSWQHPCMYQYYWRRILKKNFLRLCQNLECNIYVSRLNEIESFLPLCSLINYYHHALCMPSLELNYLKWFILVLCTDSVEVLILVPSKGQPRKFSFCRTDYLLYTTQLDTCIFGHILHRHVSVVCTDTLI